MAVRYDKEFLSEIKKVINAYNRKITRLSNKTGYDLPKKFNHEALMNLKATSKSRIEVRRRLKELQYFTTKGGEKIVQVGKATMPKYQYETIKSYRRLATYRINKKLKRYEAIKPVSSGKKSKRTFAELGEDDYLTLLTKKEKLLDVKYEDMTFKEIEMYIHKLRVNTRDYDLELWQQNYIDIFQDTALSYGYDPNKLESIVYALQNLSPEQFDELSFENRNIKAVLTHYESLLDIKSAKDMEKNSEAVIDNLDSIYEHLDDVFSYLKR